MIPFLLVLGDGFTGVTLGDAFAELTLDLVFCVREGGEGIFFGVGTGGANASSLSVSTNSLSSSWRYSSPSSNELRELQLNVRKKKFV